MCDLSWNSSLKGGLKGGTRSRERLFHLKQTRKGTTPGPTHEELPPCRKYRRLLGPWEAAGGKKGGGEIKTKM